jgi:hypothetical protein
MVGHILNPSSLRQEDCQLGLHSETVFFFFLKLTLLLLVVQACNPSTQKIEAGDLEFEASLKYIVRACLKKRKKLAVAIS